MVNWKVVLAVIIIAILAMAVGMWFGYRYVSEQEEISPEVYPEPSDAALPRHNQPRMLAVAPAKIP